MDSSPSKAALASQLWRELFQLLMSTRPHRDLVLERYGLTPNDAKALHSLDTVEGKPMRALAAEWGTDASNATWVVDRLERKGLAERRTMASDRRVKLVVLTRNGAETRDAILRGFYEPPAELLALNRRDLQTLQEILGKLPLVERMRASSSTPPRVNEEPPRSSSPK